MTNNYFICIIIALNMYVTSKGELDGYLCYQTLLDQLFALSFCPELSLKESSPIDEDLDTLDPGIRCIWPSPIQWRHLSLGEAPVLLVFGRGTSPVSETLAVDARRHSRVWSEVHKHQRPLNVAYATTHSCV